jgi:hypothetical protein
VVRNEQAETILEKSKSNSMATCVTHTPRQTLMAGYSGKFIRAWISALLVECTTDLATNNNESCNISTSKDSTCVGYFHRKHNKYPNSLAIQTNSQRRPTYIIAHSLYCCSANAGA